MANSTNLKQVDLDKQLEALQRQYLDELPDKIDEIDNLILELERTDDTEMQMRVISGHIHTVKGTAGSYGLSFASTICHNFEDYLATVHISEDGIESHIDVFMKFTGLLRDYADSYVSEEGEEIERFKSRLADLLPKVSHKKQHRILIIETTKSIAHQYTKILKKLHFDISFAKHGYEALGRLLKEDFDSLITVAQTELLDGVSLIAALRVIKSNNQNIPTLLITSNTTIDLPKLHRPDYVLIKRPELMKELENIYEEISQKENEGTSGNVDKVEPDAGNEEKTLRKILYIDDDKEIQPLVKLGLKKIATLEETEFHTSGKEALNIVPRFKPDLILSDVMMPDLDGLEVLERLRKHPASKSTPVIFLTAKDSESEIKSLKEAGAAGVINKPFNIKTFAESVLEIWEGSK